MINDLSIWIVGAIIYLSIPFTAGYLCRRGSNAAWVLNHPATLSLSVGVTASAWALFGTIELAAQSGFVHLTYYIGTSLLFVLAPFILTPILKIARRFQLQSLADLLTYRYRSGALGALVSIIMLIAMLPLIAMQIKVIHELVLIICNDNPNAIQAANITVASIYAIFTATAISTDNRTDVASRQPALLGAVAVETILKLSALLALGIYAVKTQFGSASGLQHWLSAHPQYLSALYSNPENGSIRTLSMMFMASSLGIPYLFHLLAHSQPSAKKLRAASWLVPLIMLLFAIPVLPILWAGTNAGLSSPRSFFPLTLPMQNGDIGMAIIVFATMLGASASVIIVSAIALANMLTKHLVLPLSPLNPKANTYRQLRNIKSSLLLFIMIAGYLFWLKWGDREQIANLGIASITAVLQFLPGAIAVLYWKGANRNGVFAGLIAGSLVWITFLAYPSAEISAVLNRQSTLAISPNVNLWASAAIASLSINCLVMMLASWLSPPRPDEQLVAERCSLDDISRPPRFSLNIRSAQEFSDRLAPILGGAMTDREVGRAMLSLNIDATEQRPYALRRLRDSLEANLCGTLGPSVAQSIVDQLFPYSREIEHGEDIYFIENHLARQQDQLYGLAAELDDLRRHYQETLKHLPIGLCSVGRDGEILMWNDTISHITGIPEQIVIGGRLSNLRQPWNQILQNFIADETDFHHKISADSDQGQRWLSLHKTARTHQEDDDQIIILEDITDTQLLENELIHSERLASIGRLAAGVAHEIGNPVTGIACLAQNLNYDLQDQPDLQMSSEEILKQTDRIRRILQTLVNFSHGGNIDATEELIPISIHACVNDAIHLLELNRDATPVQFINQCPVALELLADEQRFIQILINLLSNARDASPAGGKISIAADHCNEEIHIHISDEGHGIDKAIQEKIFEPFFTTKDTGAGTGLGLALVYSLVEQHGGHIELDSPLTANGGTRFTLSFPRNSK